MKNSYYVYAYIRNTNGTPYYIGKGKGRRAYAKHKGITVPKNKDLIVFLERNLTEVGAMALERRLIKWWGRKDLYNGILMNRTDGGDGFTNMSKEHRQKLSKIHKGKTISVETRKKISSSNIGKIRSEETKLKMSNSFKGRVRSEQWRIKQSISQRGKKKPKTEEHKEKVRLAKILPIEHESQIKTAEEWSIILNKSKTTIRRWAKDPLNLGWKYTRAYGEV